MNKSERVEQMVDKFNNTFKIGDVITYDGKDIVIIEEMSDGDSLYEFIGTTTDNDGELYNTNYDKRHDWYLISTDTY